MFNTFIVQPIFNLLVLVYGLLPGHNFGLALIIFTVIVRLILWPLVRKQLHQTKAMRKLQPELKKIKAASKGDRAKEQAMTMELYKEQGINPIGMLPVTIIQVVVLLGLYSGLRRVIANSHNLVTFAYPAVRHLGWLQQLSHNSHLFDNTLFGFVNLSRSTFNPGGGYYIPALVIALASAVAQYYQSKQLMPQSANRRSLRSILKDAGEGKPAEQSEVSDSINGVFRYILPVFIFLFTVHQAAALGLYWLTGGIVAVIQQSIILRSDETEMETIADGPSRDVSAIPEAEVVAVAATTKPKYSPKNKAAKKRKKR